MTMTGRSLKYAAALVLLSSGVAYADTQAATLEQNQRPNQMVSWQHWAAARASIGAACAAGMKTNPTAKESATPCASRQ
jgi:hypothetical protein